jgi:hypothetical protein
MNRRLGAIIAIAIIVIFAGFIAYDLITGNLFADKPVQETEEKIVYPPTAWNITATIPFPEGTLKAVAVTTDGRVIAGGSKFVTLFSRELTSEWTVETEKEITALSAHGNTIYVATESTILLYDLSGKHLTEWGPWEDNSLITSVASGDNFVAFADASLKRVYVLNNDGSLRNFFGHNEEKFIVPSPFFDLAIAPQNTIIVVNPGKTRVEERDPDGGVLAFFGEPGLDPAAFSGCCNPSHIALLGNGNIVTSEKGINRIKIMTPGGELAEYVSIPEQFSFSLPFDLAATGTGEIYAASAFDSRIYVFKPNQ